MRARVLAWCCLLAMCCGLACERGGAPVDKDRPPTPTPTLTRDATTDRVRDPSYRIIYAARTDEAPDKSPNGTYFSIVEDDALFVVADAADPDVSKRAAELIDADLAGECKAVVEDERKLRCVVERTHAALAARRQITALVVVMVRGNRALVSRAGNATLVWRRGDALEVIDTMESALGSPAWRFNARRLDIGRGDTLLLMNRRLRAAASDDLLRAATDARVATKAALETAVTELVTRAAESRAPSDAFSVIAARFAPGERTD